MRNSIRGKRLGKDPGDIDGCLQDNIIWASIRTIRNHTRRLVQMDSKIPKLMIDELEARIPIIQGGMSVGISLAGLASAVANIGGIGVIGAAGINSLDSGTIGCCQETNAEALVKEIRKARELTNGIIGVNIMMALTDYANLIMASIEEEVDIIFLGAGLLLKAPETLDMERIKNSKTKIVPIVSSERGAMVTFKFWSRQYGFVPDAIVVEGPMAGGHLGFLRDEIYDSEYQLEKILPKVIDIVKPYREEFNKQIPVIAAGGIYTGEDIYKYIQMGASGVQMGTRFVATEECDASIGFKEAYLNCTKEDITIINSPVGMPGRAINNNFIEDISNGIKKPFKCPLRCLRTCDFKNSPYCIALVLLNAKKGLLDEGFAFAGENAYRVDKILTVKELFKELIDGYDEAVSNMSPAPRAV